MPRYIDADKLINEFGNCTLATWGKGLGASWWSQSVKLKDNMVECINNQPTADVEEVVRCCDCTYAHFNPDANAFKCQRRGYYSEDVKPDDFCNHGVRMVTNNGNK